MRTIWNMQRTRRKPVDRSSMQRIRGLNDIRTSTELGNPEIQVRFDREKLARLGLDENQVSNAVRSKVRGDVATRYREDDKQIEILVRADESQRNTIESIQNLLINVPNQRTPGRSGSAANALAAGPAATGGRRRPESLADACATASCFEQMDLAESRFGWAP